MGAHAESFGFYSDNLEKLAELADWVMGSAAEMRKAGDGGETNARWNANAFWNLKSAQWPDLNQEEQAQAEKLDFFVKSSLSRLESHLAVLSDTGSDERAVHEGLAVGWAQEAKKHATNSGSSRLIGAGDKVVLAAQEATEWNAKNVIDDRYSTAFKDAGKDLAKFEFIGIPAWVWITGAALYALWYYMPRGNR